MNSLILCIMLSGQMPANPGLPWQNEAQRQQWITNMRIQQAYAEKVARQGRIARDRATGAAFAVNKDCKKVREY